MIEYKNKKNLQEIRWGTLQLSNALRSKIKMILDSPIKFGFILCILKRF